MVSLPALLIFGTAFFIIICSLVVAGALSARLASQHPQVLERIGSPLRNELDFGERSKRARAWLRFLFYLEFRELGDRKLNTLCYATIAIHALFYGIFFTLLLLG